MLADAYLPITGDVDGTWDAHMAHRAAARAFLGRSGPEPYPDGARRVRPVAGRVPRRYGEMRVECWNCRPRKAAPTDNFFALLGQIWQGDGTVMTQVNLPATADARPSSCS